MFAIAFHESEYVFYEGQIGYGRAVWPAPVLSVATLIANQEDTRNIPESHTLVTQMVFREDSFDPVTRIRRGRIYKWADSHSQPHSWKVQPHPAYTDEMTAAGSIRKNLFTWSAWPAFRELGGPTSRPMIALGSRDAYTLWRAVDIERIVTGEDLITLRAKSALGLLPEVNIEVIPAAGRDKVLELVDKLLNTAHRAGAESTIDSARAVAQWCIGVWLAERRGDGKLRQEDLGRLANMLREEKDVASHMGHVLARLHSRTKPNEQERYESRALREDDGDLAVAAVGMLLRELGWAR